MFFSERLIVFGSYTPGKLDTQSFKGMGNYGIYIGNDLTLKYTDRKRILSRLVEDLRSDFRPTEALIVT